MALLTWAFRRQFFYVLVFAVLFLVFGFFVIYPSFSKPPTCADNRQNGEETGVDCGGACARACLFEVDEVSVLWTRAFRVVPGRYNAVAYRQNHNKNTAASGVNYRFRFADKNNVYIGKREGRTFIPPSGKFAIFEPGIDIGNSVPVYTTFEFTEVPQWTSIPQEKINQLQVLVSNIVLTNEKTSPALSATIKNNSLFVIKEIDVIAILYDANRNAVSASRTYIEELAPEEAVPVNFTWPEPFTAPVVAKEIIPMYNVD